MVEDRKMYFVRVRGRVTGPFSLAELREQVSLGTLTRVHEVSPDRRTWRPASELDDFFSTPPASDRSTPDTPPSKPTKPSQVVVIEPDGAGSAYPPPIPVEAEYGARSPDALTRKKTEDSRQADPLERFLRGLNRLCIAESFCFAVVILFCTHVPHTRDEDGLIWWWDTIGRGESVWLVVFSIYSILIAFTLPFIAFLTTGRARGWVFASAGGAGLCLLIGVTVGGPIPCAALAVAIIPSALPALLIGLQITRSVAPEPGAGKIVNGLFGGFCCATSLIALLVAMISLLGMNPQQALPGWAIASAIVVALGWSAGIAGSVISLTAARASSSSGTAGKVCIIVLLSSFVLLGAAAAITGFGLADLYADQMEGAKFLPVQVLRLVVAVFSLNALSAIGVSGILTDRWNRNKRTQKNLSHPAGIQSQ